MSFCSLGFGLHHFLDPPIAYPALPLLILTFSFSIYSLKCGCLSVWLERNKNLTYKDFIFSARDKYSFVLMVFNFVNICCQLIYLMSTNNDCLLVSARMLRLTILCLVASCAYAGLMKPDFGLLTDEEIDFINKVQTQWKVRFSLYIREIR